MTPIHDEGKRHRFSQRLAPASHRRRLAATTTRASAVTCTGTRRFLSEKTAVEERWKARACGVLGACVVLLLSASSSAQERSSERAIVAFAFEPHLTTLGQNDAQLKDYGFQPVDLTLLPTYGIRGRFEFEGWLLGGAMSYGFASSEGDVSSVPTATTWMAMAMSGGRSFAGTGLSVMLDAGFAVLTHAVGSEVQGGALVYMGPMVHPRVAFNPLDAPFVQLTLGYMVQTPLGTAHDNPLWEEGFERALVHGLTFGIEMGGAR